MTKRGVLERPLQKPPNRSVVFLRQHDLDQVPRDFLRWFLYLKPPPLTKMIQCNKIRKKCQVKFIILVVFKLLNMLTGNESLM